MIRVTALLMVFALGSMQSIKAQTESERVDTLGIVDSNNRFALDLYQELRSSEGNLFYSPSSIFFALSMTYAGAAGETELEMAKTLHISPTADRLHEQMQALQTSWNETDPNRGIRLRLANRLWASMTYQFRPEFLSVTREHYGAELARLDFAQAEAAREMINRWVEAQTENRIRDLIPPNSISADTKTVLTNAIYFYGDWATAFGETLTEPADFHRTESSKVVVSMMHRRDWFHYLDSEADNLKILELPYGDGSLSMVVLLPGRKDGLANLEQSMTYANFERWAKDLTREREVLVYLPRFEASSGFELSERLEAMGMASAFDSSRADFSGMTEEDPLFLSQVIHKAFIGVDEKGTEAAAATAVLPLPAGPADGGDSGPPPAVFRADHPFLFMIRDNRSGAIQFIGRITDPPLHNYNRDGNKREGVVDRARRKSPGDGNITGRIDTQCTLRGTLTLSRSDSNNIESDFVVKIGSANPRFEFLNVPEGVYNLNFRGTKDGTTTPLSWKGLQLDRPGEPRELPLTDAE